jgi:hypothetical protein
MSIDEGKSVKEAGKAAVGEVLDRSIDGAWTSDQRSSQEEAAAEEADAEDGRNCRGTETGARGRSCRGGSCRGRRKKLPVERKPELAGRSCRERRKKLPVERKLPWNVLNVLPTRQRQGQRGRRPTPRPLAAVVVRRPVGLLSTRRRQGQRGRRPSPRPLAAVLAACRRTTVNG